MFHKLNDIKKLNNQYEIFLKIQTNLQNCEG